MMMRFFFPLRKYHFPAFLKKCIPSSLIKRLVILSIRNLSNNIETKKPHHHHITASAEQSRGTDHFSAHIPLIHQFPSSFRRIHMTNTGKACFSTAAQILYFVWPCHMHTGHLCNRYLCFFPHAPTRLATTTWAAGFFFLFFFFAMRKKKMSWLKRSILCLCMLWFVERGRGGGGKQGWATALGLCCMKRLSCLIHETQSPPMVTMAATFSYLCITLDHGVQRQLIDTSTLADHLFSVHSVL